MIVVGFLLLRSKVKVDAKHDLHYCGAKMATSLDMFVKYGLKVTFESNTSTSTGDPEKLRHEFTENDKL